MRRHAIHVDLHFAIAAQERNDAPALEAGGSVLRYGELDTRASALAGELAGLGGRSGTRIALLLEKSDSFLVALLAVWKIGGTAILSDPAWPSARLAHVLAAARPALVIEAEGARPWQPGMPGPSARAGGQDGVATQACRAPAGARPWAALASTCHGFGVSRLLRIGHDAIAARVECLNAACSLSSTDRTTWFSPVWAAHGLGEIWATLCAGGCLVIPPAEAAAVPRRFQAWLLSSAISVAYVPMPLAGLLCAGSWDGAGALRRIVVATDPPLRPELFRTPVPVILEFGDAEANVFSFLELPPAETASGPISLGRPYPGVHWRLAGDGKPPKAGGIGELLVSSPCMASGYDDAGEEPDVEGRKRTFHRTGMLARATGTADELAFEGYADRRLYAYGRLIPWQELERLLQHHPDIDAVRMEADGPQPRLESARITVETRSGSLTTAEVRCFLQDWLPFTLVPRAIRVDATKADGARPGSEPPANAIRGHAAPEPIHVRRELLESVLAIWSITLDRPDIAPDANFLEIGGNSFHAGLITGQIAQQFGVRIRMRDLLHLETPARQADHIARHETRP